MIHVEGSNFKDEQGRTLLLRGVNLGGSTKVPYTPDGASHIQESFFNHRQVSFVGRPFPLAEADEHFKRLRQWGFTFLRLLTTWEAIEHAGPGQYDEEYLDYLYAIVKKAGEYGMTLFIDPHEDVWSRFSGGDGAPGWTLEAVGFDMTHFKETGAAIVHQTYGDPFPRMIWPTNNGKLAAATLFTLFFAGNDFAPNTKIESEPAQEYLQRHYIEAIRQVALRLKEFKHVVGYDSLNEPGSGYIGVADLTKPLTEVETGALPSPFQSMLLGAGIPQSVDTWERGFLGPRRVSTQLMNAEGVRAWREGYECVWKQNGVWDLDAGGKPALLDPDHFAVVNGHKVDFSQDYLRPFANRFAQAIRSAHPGALIFVETTPGLQPLVWGKEDAPDIVNAIHWYDGVVLFLKQYSPWLGFDSITNKLVLSPGAIRQSYTQQLELLKQSLPTPQGNAPLLLGEIGIPFDLNNAKAYRTGDFKDQSRAANRSLQALEDNLISFTWWNYTADNINARGDKWNGEDLSIFSRDQQHDPKDINSGGRALEALLRPYPKATAGQPLRLHFDYRTGSFEFEFRHDPAVSAPTELYVPAFQYPQGCKVQVSDGSYELDPGSQTLLYHHSPEKETHIIRINR
jgi:Glycoside hydrolase family 5 C-terminal domain/Cellulase (glycosyl hydrolase family 5)